MTIRPRSHRWTVLCAMLLLFAVLALPHRESASRDAPPTSNNGGDVRVGTSTETLTNINVALDGIDLVPVAVGGGGSTIA